MKAKKTLIIAMLMLFAGIAQTSSAQFKYGVEIGWQSSPYLIKYEGSSNIPEKLQSGFRVGGIVSYTYRGIGWFEAGISLSKLGLEIYPNRYADGYLKPMSMARIKQYSLEIPLWFGLKIDAGKDFSIIPKAGIFFNYGIKGNGYIDCVDEAGPFSKKFDIYDEKGSYSDDARALKGSFDRSDGGAQLGLDVMWRQFSFRTAYQLGLSEHTYFSHKAVKRMLSLSAGYYF